MKWLTGTIKNYLRMIFRIALGLPASSTGPPACRAIEPYDDRFPDLASHPWPGISEGVTPRLHIDPCVGGTRVGW